MSDVALETSVIAARAPRCAHQHPGEDAEFEHFVCEECGNVVKSRWTDRDRLADNRPLCQHTGAPRWFFAEMAEAMTEHGWEPMVPAEVRARR